MTKLSKTQKELLAAIGRGGVAYSRSTNSGGLYGGEFGRATMATYYVLSDRKLVESTQNERMWYRMDLELTPAGRELLASLEKEVGG